jgi:hypothetical protein
MNADDSLIEGKRMASITGGVIAIVWGVGIQIYSANQKQYGGAYGAGQAIGSLFGLVLIGVGIYALVNGIRAANSRTFKPRKRRRPKPRRYRDDDYDDKSPRRRSSSRDQDDDDDDDEPRSRRSRDRDREDDDDDRRPRRTSRRRDDDD